MKLILIFLLFPIFSFSQQYLAYCDSYKISFEEVNRGIVIQIKNDSIRTYIHSIGYIWWKIDKVESLETIPKTTLVDRAELHLSKNEHKSTIFINRNKIVQIILLKGDPDIVFVIELTRKDLKL